MDCGVLMGKVANTIKIYFNIFIFSQLSEFLLVFDIVVFILSS